MEVSYDSFQFGRGDFWIIDDGAGVEIAVFGRVGELVFLVLVKLVVCNRLNAESLLKGNLHIETTSPCCIFDIFDITFINRKVREIFALGGKYLVKAFL